ncbi:vascular cell adhesion protein 1-like [Pholidichthys leucotaenia]
MAVSYMLLLVSFMNVLRDFRVSSCIEQCKDKPVFTPTSLAVMYGDSASASCVVCNGCEGRLETPLGDKEENGTTVHWKVDRMTEWDPNIQCYYLIHGTDDHCCTKLPVTLYQPPKAVSISFLNHNGPMLEASQYTLECNVENVAPIKNLDVMIYKGETLLGHLQSGSQHKKPVSERFQLNVTTTEKDDGAHYWCKAKLQLGPDGPESPPVVKSENISSTVYYGPRLLGPANPDPVTVTEGDTLQLNCSAVGNPSPSYTWTVPSGSPQPASGSILTINSVHFEEGGTYACHVSGKRTITVDFTVNVQGNYLPYIILGVIIGVVALLIPMFVGYRQYYKKKRTGRYNLKDVFSLQPRDTM